MHSRRPLLTAFRERTADRTVGASSDGDTRLTGVFILGTLIVAALATYTAGGSKTAFPHAFYVPVIIAAVRFRAWGALVAALAAGLIAGPLMPLDVAASSSQEAVNWLARLLAFVLIGQLTAYLTQHSLPSLTAEVCARRFRQDLRGAISHGHVRVEYQPIVDLSTGDLVGAEVLARWDHPSRGVVPPDEFVAQAEKTGCIDELSRYVLDTACRQVMAWRQTLLADRESFKLAVNISASELVHHETLTQRVSDILEETGLPNHWLHLEITETALVEDVDNAVNALMALRMLGVQLAIDDFGTGESSLSYLDRFPVDVLKIDQRFVARLDHEHRSDALTHGVIALAHAMGFTTVAEGIETRTQAVAIRGYGCDLAQGYLFSKPLRPERLAELLANHRSFRDTNVAHLAPVRVESAAP